jgi:hypothetical protein
MPDLTVPQQTEPLVTSRDADELLNQALAGIEWGAYDARTLAWAQDMLTSSTKAVIASWLLRARAAGPLSDQDPQSLPHS